MEDIKANARKSELDSELANVGPNVGIAFGPDLFEAFRTRNWLSLETFGVLGTTLFETKLPAYGRTHYAFSTWDIQADEFKVGRDA